MAKIVPFTKLTRTSSKQTQEKGLEAFVDNGELLEFPETDSLQTDAIPQAHKQTRNSCFASDWSNQELADLYRAHALVQAAQPGLECDRGLSDENDPWFLIGDENGDVLVHICRIKGIYILDSAALSEPLRGRNFNDLIENFLATVAGEEPQDADAVHERANVVRLGHGGTVCLHPSVMIAALIWTLLVNSDELSLPPSSGTTQKVLDQGQHQGAALLDSDDNPELPNALKPAAFDKNPMQSEPNSEVSDGLSFRVMTAQIVQKEEKQLHASVCSHALTTIAIAAGFYASTEGISAFWKIKQSLTDLSTSLSETEAREVQDQSTPFDHLSEALTLLTNTADLVAFESHAEYETASRDVYNDNEDALLASSENASTSIAQQMLSKASEVFGELGEASETIATNASNKGIGDAIYAKAFSSERADTAFLLDGKALGQTTEKGSFASFVEAYASRDTDVIRYDVSSFATGLGKFGGELQKYSKAFGAAAGEDDYLPTSTLSEPTGKLSFKEFDDEVRKFIDEKIATGDLEMLVFAKEIIFVDKATFSDASKTVSWQLEDGGVVSMIGLSSDMAEFLVA